MPADPDESPPAGRLAPGLYLVATPIGAARDITLRGLDILREADVLAAEDTRRLRQLLAIHGVPLQGRRVLAYHDHNDAEARPRLLAALAAGKSVAYAPEAGTPLVSDPGYQLARDARAAGHAVHAAPGASAVLAALAVAGLPTDRFLFAGFPPAKAGARQAFLAELATVPATLVLYEAPGRVGRTLGDLSAALGEGREAAVCRELTKRFEEVTRGTLGSLAAIFAGRDLRGEVVLVIHRAAPAAASAATVDTALREALARRSLRDAADEVAAQFGVPRKEAYRRALQLKDGS
jgi:16S rRNA (cytidine1402-2'-O)-methyltransferase